MINCNIRSANKNLPSFFHFINNNFFFFSMSETLLQKNMFFCVISTTFIIQFNIQTNRTGADLSLFITQ